jgi:hypothetical protein
LDVTEFGRIHKLDSLVHGPYRIVENAGHTFRLQVGSDIFPHLLRSRVVCSSRFGKYALETAPPEYHTQTPSSGDVGVEETPSKGKETEPGNGNGVVASRVPLPVTPSQKTVPPYSAIPTHCIWEGHVRERARTREEYAIERSVDSGYGEVGAILYRVS